MLESSIDIGHYAKIPIHVVRARISKSAKALWTELALLSSPEKPQVWIRQETIAAKMSITDRTVRRLIAELEKAQLITPIGWHQGRHKKYDLSWTVLSDVGGQSGQECPTSLDENIQPPRTKLSRHGGQKCPDLNKVINKAEEQNIYFKKTREEFLNPEQEAQKLLAEWGDVWKKRFLCLDGLSGRPSVETCVEQALSHSSRKKYANSKIHVEVWLQKAARDWALSFNRELNAPPTDPALDPEAKARRSQAESERSKKYYSQSRPVAEFKAKPIPAELQEKIDQVMANQQPGWVETLRKLMKNHERKLEAQAV